MSLDAIALTLFVEALIYLVGFSRKALGQRTKPAKLNLE